MFEEESISSATSQLFRNPPGVERNRWEMSILQMLTPRYPKPFLQPSDGDFATWKEKETAKRAHLLGAHDPQEVRDPKTVTLFGNVRSGCSDICWQK